METGMEETQPVPILPLTAAPTRGKDINVDHRSHSPVSEVTMER